MDLDNKHGYLHPKVENYLLFIKEEKLFKKREMLKKRKRTEETLKLYKTYFLKLEMP